MHKVRAGFMRECGGWVDSKLVVAGSRTGKEDMREEAGKWAEPVRNV